MSLFFTFLTNFTQCFHLKRIKEFMLEFVLKKKQLAPSSRVASQDFFFQKENVINLCRCKLQQRSLLGFKVTICSSIQKLCIKQLPQTTKTVFFKLDSLFPFQSKNKDFLENGLVQLLFKLKSLKLFLCLFYFYFM